VNARRRLLVLVWIAAGGVLAGCGATVGVPTPTGGAVSASAAVSARAAVVPPTQWPSEADYGTIRVAAAVRDDALFNRKDWRQRKFEASMALRTLLTVRVAPGRCADYVTELFGSLRDLADGYAGEDWRPLVRLVHGQPSARSACRPPVDQVQSLVRSGYLHGLLGPAA
jgi:hypothetical protein